jgi:hypothetical protein
MSEQQNNYGTRGKTIFRVEKNKDNPFVMIDRRPIENPTLSWRAKGILTYLISRPDNWIVRLGDLVNRSPDGVYAVRSALRELTKAGHLTRREERENGKFKQYVLLVHEIPITSTPTNLPQAVEPQAGNLTLNDTESNDTELNGASAETSVLPLDWQIGMGAKTIVIPDNTQARRKDIANLIAMGMGASASLAYQIALAFMDTRNIVIPESKAKAQRKAIREMVESGVSPRHVTEAVKKLMESRMTVTDLYSVSKTAIDLANQAEPEKTRLL